MDLLVGLLVHEHDLVAGVVEVLDVLGLGVDAGHLLAGAEGALDDGARVEILELGAHEGAALARLYVLELDDAPDDAVKLDVHAVLELIGADYVGHRRASLPNPPQTEAHRHLAALGGANASALRPRPRPRP